MLRIVNRTQLAQDDKERIRLPRQIEKIVLHRIWSNHWALKDPHTAEEVIGLFKTPEVGKYTGMEQPYNFLIEPTGRIVQVLKICDVGIHAKKWNSTSEAVAFLGDFRVQPVTKAAWQAGLELVAELCTMLDLDPLRGKGKIEDMHVVCHDELPGGSSDADKRCPGRKFDIDGFCLGVYNRMQALAAERLLACGAEF